MIKGIITDKKKVKGWATKPFNYLTDKSCMYYLAKRFRVSYKMTPRNT